MFHDHALCVHLGTHSLRKNIMCRMRIRKGLVPVLRHPGMTLVCANLSSYNALVHLCLEIATREFRNSGRKLVT